MCSPTAHVAIRRREIAISIAEVSSKTVTPMAGFGKFIVGIPSTRGGSMSNLNNIEHRHERDGWKDAIFVVLAVVLTALSIGSVTSKAAGHPHAHQWSVTVIENPELAK
jgi:hypothetical protein